MLFSCSKNLNKKVSNIDYNKIFEFFETTERPSIAKKVDLDLTTEMKEYLKQNKKSVVVLVKATVDTFGNVIDTDIFKSEPLFDKSAMKSVRQFKIKPAKYEGRKVKVYFMIPIKYN